MSKDDSYSKRIAYKNLVVSSGSGMILEPYRLSEDNVVDSLADVLRHPRGGRRWSPHVWTSNAVHRRNWVSASAAVIDFTYLDPCGRIATPSDELLRLLSTEFQLGNVLHFTPEGGRLIFVFKAPVVIQSLYQRALKGAATILGEEFGSADDSAHLVGTFRVNPAPASFVERFDVPQAAAESIGLSDSVFVISPEPYSPLTLASPFTGASRSEVGINMAIVRAIRRGVLERLPHYVYRVVKKKEAVD